MAFLRLLFFVVAGGGSDHRFCEVYSFKTDEWSYLHDLPYTGHVRDANVITIGDRVVVWLYVFLVSALCSPFRTNIRFGTLRC